MSAWEPIGAPVIGATTAVPSAPQNLLASSGNARVVAQWDAPFSDGGRTLTTYQIVLKHTGSTVATKTVAAPIEDVTFVAADGVVNGTTYQFFAKASNNGGATYGSQAGPSNTVTPASVSASPPSAPQNLTATAGTLRIVVSWTAPSSNGGSAITNYRVILKKASDSSVVFTKIGAATWLSTIFTEGNGVQANVAYVLTAEASNDGGATWGTVAGPTAPVTPTAGKPGRPATVNSSEGNRTIGVLWTAPTDDGGLPVNMYRARLRLTSGATLIATRTLNGLGTTFDASDGVQNNVAYDVFVAASNDGGQTYGSETESADDPNTPFGTATVLIKELLGGGRGNGQSAGSTLIDVAIMVGRAGNPLSSPGWGSTLRTSSTPADLTLFAQHGLRSICVFPPTPSDFNSRSSASINAHKSNIVNFVHSMQNAMAAGGQPNAQIIHELWNEPNNAIRSQLPDAMENHSNYAFWANRTLEAIRSVGLSNHLVITGGALGGPTLSSTPWSNFFQLTGGVYRAGGIVDWHLNLDDPAIVGNSQRISQQGYDGLGAHPYWDTNSYISRRNYENPSPAPSGTRVGLSHANNFRYLTWLSYLFSTDWVGGASGNKPVAIYCTEQGEQSAPSFHNDGRTYPNPASVYVNQGSQRSITPDDPNAQNDIWNGAALWHTIAATTTAPGGSSWRSGPGGIPDPNGSDVTYGANESMGTEHKVAHTIDINIQVMTGQIHHPDWIQGSANFTNPRTNATDRLPAHWPTHNYIAKWIWFRLCDNQRDRSGAGGDFTPTWRYGFYYNNVSRYQAGGYSSIGAAPQRARKGQSSGFSNTALGQLDVLEDAAAQPDPRF